MDDRIRKLALTITHWVGSPVSIVLHTLIFVSCFLLAYLEIVAFDKMLLVLTTIVSLEAIYLSIFIQMTINYTTKTIEGVEENIEELQEDVEEIQEDVGEMQEDVEEISEDVDELQEDVEEMSEDDKHDEIEEDSTHRAINAIQNDLKKLLEDIDKLKKTQ